MAGSSPGDKKKAGGKGRRGVSRPAAGKILRRLAELPDARLAPLLNNVSEISLTTLREALEKGADSLGSRKTPGEAKASEPPDTAEPDARGERRTTGQETRTADVVFGRLVAGPQGEPHVELGLSPPAGIREADRVRIFIDGASRGNPGPAAVGVVFEDAEGGLSAEGAARLGVMTNNAAEYHGLISALRQALDWGVKRVEVLTDSELLARQMNGAYAVKSPLLAPLYRRAKSLRSQLEYCSIRHVPRAMNRRADELANLALDRAPAP